MINESMALIEVTEVLRQNIFETIVEQMKNNAQDRLDQKRLQCFHSLLNKLLNESNATKDEQPVQSENLHKQLDLIEDYLDAIPLTPESKAENE
ncbi:MAG: hypothetical protein HRT38_02595 [Alteromonadaceae bacterium]|nr:hypothetical protein [Alteromonadaceae bacterium]